MREQGRHCLEKPIKYLRLRSCRLLRLRIFLRPLSRRSNGLFLILLPALCDVGCKWVVRVRRAEQRLDGEENRSNLECRRPVV